MNSVIPLADIFGPPLAGFLADKLGNFRLFMAALTLLNGASSLLLLAIPSVIASEQLNEEFALGIVGNNWFRQEFWSYLTVRVLLDVLRSGNH